MFASFKKEIENLLVYQNYLDSQNKKMRLSHDSCAPVRKLSESLSIEVIKKINL